MIGKYFIKMHCVVTAKFPWGRQWPRKVSWRKVSVMQITMAMKGTLRKEGLSGLGSFARDVQWLSTPGEHRAAGKPTPGIPQCSQYLISCLSLLQKSIVCLASPKRTLHISDFILSFQSRPPFSGLYWFPHYHCTPELIPRLFLQSGFSTTF